MSVTYVYRADGLRHSKTSNHTRVTHVWNGAHIVLELNASNAVINRFYRGGGGRLLRSEHHGWYLFNARGDVVQRVDNAGELLHTYHYDAFGVERDQDEGNTNPFRFAGEYYDWETATIYLRARVYNPRTGRFTQEDPFWNVGNMQDGSLAIMQAGNLYMYCVHNPVMFVDPSGLNLRAFAEANNGTVVWNAATSTATVTVNNITRSFTEGVLGTYINSSGSMVVYEGFFAAFGLSSAGSWFISADAAAAGFAKENLPRTFEDNRERGSFIYRRNFNGVPLFTYFDMPRGGHADVVRNVILGTISAGATFSRLDMLMVAFVHTHPHCYCHRGTEFSSQDKWPTRFLVPTVYLAATNGNLYAYDRNGGLRPNPVATGLPLPTYRFPRRRR
ncbi:MAG: hypothetical protein FWC96_05955 [Oscillospiraceae bacterium]|nr:hypothetical protein [Oscillospiraceae bacterium]